MVRTFKLKNEENQVKSVEKLDFGFFVTKFHVSLNNSIREIL